MKKIALFTFLFAFLISPASQAHDKESVYERVIKSGKIKCAYYIAPPYFNKDPVTGKFSGIFYEYVESLGKKLNLKIDWNLEVGLGDLVEAIRLDRVDAYCAGLWNNPARAKNVDFNTPV